MFSRSNEETLRSAQVGAHEQLVLPKTGQKLYDLRGFSPIPTLLSATIVGTTFAPEFLLNPYAI